MAKIFISYARSTEAQADALAGALRAEGHEVWRDDALPAHRPYAEVIEERLREADAVVVVWSADAAKSQWVRAEADLARQAATLVQLSVDGAAPPIPFNQIQCADLSGWTGDADAPGLRKVLDSIAELARGAGRPPMAEPGAPLPASSTAPSIAVMPFANLSNDPEQDYFADGMQEEIVAALSRFRSIFVIASGSTMAFKGKSLSAQEVGRRLGVRYVLEGSVRKAGERVRIAVKLIDAADGAQIWTDRFEDTLDDIFALQDRVALSVAGVIEPTVREAEIRRAAKRPTADMGSYDLYLRAQAIMRTYDWNRIFEALGLLERAVEADPQFGSALAHLSGLHYLIVLYGWSDDPELHRRMSIELGRRALMAAPDDAHVLGRVAAMFAYLEQDLPNALRMTDQALALNPGSSTAWFWSGAVRILTGDVDLAVEHLETGARLDPLGPERVGRLLFLAMARFQQRRFEDAAALGAEVGTQNNNPTGFAILAASLGHLGRPEAAREALQRYRDNASQSIEAYARAIWLRDEARELFLAGVALAEGRTAGAEAKA